MSAREWHSYMMADRRNDPREWHYLWSKGALAEQYTLGSHIQIEQHEQAEVKKRQTDLRTILPAELKQAIQNNAPQGQTIGKIFFAGKKWQGSRNHMKQCYADAQAIFNKVGRPHLFLTWTGNPNWPEIKRLTEGTNLSWHHLPQHVTRIFWAKFEELKKDLFEG